MNRLVFAAVTCLITFSAMGQLNDPFLWLEEVESKRALKWVEDQNKPTLARLESSPHFSTLQSEIRKVVLAKDRIPMPNKMGNYIYNFWQDENHVKGIWRRTSITSYRTSSPQWETVLDVDLLAKSEGESWVLKGIDCQNEDQGTCLLQLSRGGKDASVYREFDPRVKGFVVGGFYLPESKSSVTWKDKDTLLVATDFGPGTMTLSGYPRQAKLWKRGTPLEQAPLIHEVAEKDMEIEVHTFQGLNEDVSVIRRVATFYTEENWIYSEGALQKVNFPIDSQLRGYFRGDLYAQLRSDWKVNGKVLPEGSLVTLNIQTQQPQLVFTPGENASILSVKNTKDFLLVTMLEDVKSSLAHFHKVNGNWVKKDVSHPPNGTISTFDTSAKNNHYFVNFQNFITPPTVYSADGSIGKVISPKFDASSLEITQQWVASKDGTKVPYFLVHKKGLKLDGKNPTLLYGYGGFEISMVPYYADVVGKVWLEKGGVYALANIRGGGEFGPKWHEAALKENRQRAYDDFAAIAEDLINRKLTSPRHLGIMGGSNGGLLMGVTFTQRPELFEAVVCQVPLLDMLRFHKLLAGHSWTGEYGNPDNPAEKLFISKYSPYQNVHRSIKYPEVFFLTSTKDDRVHPGHARKMAAKMKSYGHDVLYYENLEGGHSAAANLEQKVHRLALEYSYLYEKLM